MKHRFTATARAELEQSIDYLIEHAPRVAASFANDIEAAIEQLAQHPFSAQQTDHKDVRRKYVRRFRYAIFYHVDVDADELIILSIRHAARRWPWR